MTKLLPSKEEVLKILGETGALREGHFILPTAIHTNFYFQMPLAFRYFDNVRRLCVGLSRLLRVCGPVAMALPDCTVIAPASGGIPVAFGVREALAASQIIWAERKERIGKFIRSRAPVREFSPPEWGCAVRVSPGEDSRTRANGAKRLRSASRRGS